MIKRATLFASTYFYSVKKKYKDERRVLGKISCLKAFILKWKL